MSKNFPGGAKKRGHGKDEEETAKKKVLLVMKPQGTDKPSTSQNKRSGFSMVVNSLEQALALSPEKLADHLEDRTLPLVRYFRASSNSNPKYAQLETHLNSVYSVLRSRSSRIISRKGQSGQARQCPSSEKNLDMFSGERKSVIEATTVKRNDGVKINFSHVFGLADAKQALSEALVYPFTYPHWYTGDRRPWRSVLLFGPPGTGKTQLADALAGEVSARFFSVSSSDIISAWSGESEKLVKELFLQARKSVSQRSVIFIDEVDSLCRNRSQSEQESTRRIKTELLIQLNALDRDGASGVYLLCATNCPWELDSAFLRRFQKRIYVPLPDTEARVGILKSKMSKTKLADDINWEELGQWTEGLSGSDLGDLAQEVLFVPVRQLQKTQHWQLSTTGDGVIPWSGDIDVRRMKMGQVPSHLLPHPPPISRQHFLLALNAIKPTVTKEMLGQYTQWTRESARFG